MLVSVTKCWPKATWVGKDLFQFMLLRPHPSSKEVGAWTWKQELEQGPRRNTPYWLAPHVLLSLLSIAPMTTCLGVALPRGSFLTHHQSGKCPTYMPAGQSEEDIFSTTVSSFQMPLAYIELTETNWQSDNLYTIFYHYNMKVQMSNYKIKINDAMEIQ